MLCKHGCGREAIYKDRCNIISQRCPVVKKKNSDALKRAHEEGRHIGWAAWSKGRPHPLKGKTAETDSRIKHQSKIYYLSDDKIFTRDCRFNNKTIRRYIEIRKIIINSCGHTEWLNKKLTLDLHHKNGITTDCRKENLIWQCPNCHSLTDNYKFKGRKHTKEAVDKIKNNFHVSRQVSLTAKQQAYTL